MTKSLKKRLIPDEVFGSRITKTDIIHRDGVFMVMISSNGCQAVTGLLGLKRWSSLFWAWDITYNGKKVDKEFIENLIEELCH